MSSIVETIKGSPNALFGKGSSENDIKAAEKQLNLKFSDEYRDYLRTFSVAIVDGHELTGLSSNKRVDVVDVTKNQSSISGNVLPDAYVIEETNIDGIVIWQNETGNIFETAPGINPQIIANSMAEYLKQ